MLARTREGLMGTRMYLSQASTVSTGLRNSTLQGNLHFYLSFTFCVASVDSILQGDGIRSVLEHPTTRTVLKIC